MLFKRFFKTRKDREPSGTRHGEIPTDAMAPPDETDLQHPDPAQRRDAARRLTDPGRLRALLREDDDAEVRERAAARYRDLLCQDPASGLTLEQRLQEVGALDDQRLLEQIAGQAPVPELRAAAIARISTQEVLAACAVNDTQATNRSLAVAALHDRAALESVARRIGKRDKRVYRLAREKLKQLAESSARPLRARAEAEALCEKVERLGRLGQWDQERALLDHLDGHWRPLEQWLEPALIERYIAARERFLAAHAAHEQAAAARRQAVIPPETAVPPVTQDSPSRSPAATPGTEPDDAASSASTATIPPPDTETPATAPEPDPTPEAAPKPVAPPPRQRPRERLERLLGRVGALLAAPKPLDLPRSATLLETANTLIQHLDPAEIPAETAERLAHLERRMARQRQQAERWRERAQERTEELRQLIDSGAIRQAEALAQSLHAGFEHLQASGLRTPTLATLRERLRESQQRLRELQQWRRWGTDQHREELCAAMEALVTSDSPPEPLAEQWRRQRREWRQLDQSGSRADPRLAERFRAASEQVHERCRAWLELQAERFETNRAAREAVCEQLETFLAQVDWSRIDWRRAAHADRELRQAWSGIGPVAPRHQRALERRFRHALGQLESRLDSERQHNLAIKAELVTQAEALADEPDLERAIERVRRLQRDWQTSVPGRQRDENRLWRAFRAACDAVYARRVALQQAQADTLESNLATREAILASLRALLDAASSQEVRALNADVVACDQRWQAARMLPVPRAAERNLEQAWRETRQATEDRLHQLRQSLQRSVFDRLAHQARHCAALEQRLRRGETLLPELDAVQAQWSALAPVDDDSLAEAMRERHRRLLEAIQDPALAASRADPATDYPFAQSCLQLEILAGIPSPPQYEHQRLQIQVARLAERMVEGEEDPLRGIDQILRDWYLTGPPLDQPELMERFERARAALDHEAPPAPPPPLSAARPGQRRQPRRDGRAT